MWEVDRHLPPIQFVGKTKGTHPCRSSAGYFSKAIMKPEGGSLTGCLGAINGPTYYYKKNNFQNKQI